ncbi:MAG: TonB-dependent receptor [Paraprevotella sp.]|nr:TonB-dependent receptor [Paraprevotella sp.]
MNKVFLATVLLTAGSSAYAAPNDESSEDSTKVRDIEEVVIVSTPKETSKLRHLPTAVSLFDRTDLEEQHTASLKELSGYVPNFYMPDYGSSLTSAAYIRGIGSRINSPAVGLYVDNVGYVDKSAYDIDLSDVDRIDVLRGPQTTLYGRNTMEGLLRVFTRNPFRYHGTDIRMSTSVKDRGYRLTASHYQKLNSKTALGLSGFYRHSDGFFENVTRHESVGGNETGGGRARLIWMPGDAWKLDFSTDYSYREDRGYPYRYLGAVDPAEEELPQQIGHIIYNRPSFYRRSLLNSSLNAQYTASRFILSSVTAFQHLKDNMTLDQDFTDADYFTLSQKQRINSWSEELTFKSRDNHRWEWIGGVYAMRQTLYTKSPVSLSGDFMNTVFDQANAAMKPMGMGLTLHMHNSPYMTDGGFDTPTTDLAAFHQSTFNDLFGLEGLSLIAGLRVEYEKMNLDYNYGGAMDYDLTLSSSMMPLTLNDISDDSRMSGSLSHDYVQCLPKVALQYHFNGKNNVYVSWSKGYRSGGYNIQMFSDLTQGDLKSRMMQSVKDRTAEELAKPAYDRMPEAVKQMIVNQIPQEPFTGSAEQTRFKPEYSYNYEVVGHFIFLDGKLEMDATAFYIDVYDQQISKFVSSGLGLVMVNAGRGQSCGAELSLRGGWLDNRLTWHAAYGYTHSVFKRYEAQAADAATAQEAVNYDGNYVPFVPMHTMAAGLEFCQPVVHKPIKSYFFGVNTTGAGKIYWSEDNAFHQPFYALLNAHFGVDFGAVRIDVWGKNLTDTDYDTFFFTSSATTRNLKIGQRGNPLQFGVDVSLHF